MTSPHLTGNDEALVAYLYDECDVEERRRIENHLAECSACASEVDDLRSVRVTLGGWAPPTVRLGFRVVADSPASTRWWARGSLPVWARAAAAVFLFAAGAAVSQLDVRYGGEGLIIRTRGAHSTDTTARTEGVDRAGPAAASAREPVRAEAGAPASDRAALAEQALRRDLAASSRPGTAASLAQDNDALLRRVQAMIEQSEHRQQQELALRLAQVVRDFDAQRRADLLRVDQNLGQLEGQTGAAVAQQRELMNYLVRVSQQP
jgi:hypothetical protein